MSSNAVLVRVALVLAILSAWAGSGQAQAGGVSYPGLCASQSAPVRWVPAETMYIDLDLRLVPAALGPLSPLRWTGGAGFGVGIRYARGCEPWGLGFRLDVDGGGDTSRDATILVRASPSVGLGGWVADDRSTHWSFRFELGPTVGFGGTYVADGGATRLYVGPLVRVVFSEAILSPSRTPMWHFALEAGVPFVIGGEPSFFAALTIGGSVSPINSAPSRGNRHLSPALVTLGQPRVGIADATLDFSGAAAGELRVEVRIHPVSSQPVCVRWSVATTDADFGSGFDVEDSPSSFTRSFDGMPGGSVPIFIRCDACSSGAPVEQGCSGSAEVEAWIR